MSDKTGSPWYRRATDSWYVWHSGRQVRLAEGKKNKAEAYARFAELIGDSPPTPQPNEPSIRDLVEAYRAYAVDRIKPSTYKAYNCVLGPFLAELGELPAGKLQPSELERWARKRRWSPTTQRYALTVTAGVFRWATRVGLIAENPVRVVTRPPGRSRGAEILIDPALHERMLAVSSPEFRDFLTVLRATGARPGEVARVEAKDIFWEARCWILSEHKPARNPATSGFFTISK